MRVKRGHGTWRGRILTLHPSGGKNGNNYLYACLYNEAGERKWLLVHRLVAEVFLGDPYVPDAVVDHIDNDPKNNRLENLQWMSHGENVAKGWRQVRKMNEELPF